ncbi:hypothetical protein V6Z11_A11G375400 [Gossypium hirsutum]
MWRRLRSLHASLQNACTSCSEHSMQYKKQRPYFLKGI